MTVYGKITLMYYVKFSNYQDFHVQAFAVATKPTLRTSNKIEVKL